MKVRNAALLAGAGGLVAWGIMFDPEGGEKLPQPPTIEYTIPSELDITQTGHVWTEAEDGTTCFIDMRHEVVGQAVVSSTTETIGNACDVGDTLEGQFTNAYHDYVQLLRTRWSEFVTDASIVQRDGLDEAFIASSADQTVLQVGELNRFNETEWFNGNPSTNYGTLQCNLQAGENLLAMGNVTYTNGLQNFELATVLTHGEGAECTTGDLVLLEP